MRSLLEDFIDCLYFINLILLSILIFKNDCKKKMEQATGIEPA